MRKTLFLLLLIFTFTIICGCQTIQNNNNNNEVKLLFNKNEIDTKYKKTEGYNDFKSIVQNFSTEISEKTYLKYQQKYDQMAISPLSIYMALAMTTSVASDYSRSELESLFNTSYQDIIQNTKYLYGQINCERLDDFTNKPVYKIQLSNSIWLNNSLTYNNEGLELLKDSFYADSYQAPFTKNNNVANKAIQDYVYRNTEGLINNKYNFDIETLFLLINTLYLKDMWNSDAEELKTTPEQYNFENKNQTISSLNLLMGNYNKGKIQQGDGFEYFYTRTSNGLRLYFVKPTTKSLDDIYKGINLNLILNDNDYNYVDYDLKEEYYTRCLFPSFNASFDENLNELLKEEYGISKIFNENYNNFDKITTQKSFIKDFSHQTKLKVDKIGIEGAAVTVMGAGGSAGPSDDLTTIYNDFIIDKSFGFMITKQDTILFSGVINNL